jgi:signal transduction histidine kinase/CheY-like chemotaxis protein
MSVSSPRARSIRTRLVLLVSALLIAVLAPLLVVTFLEVRSTLVDAGRVRAQEAANNLSDLFAQSARQRFLDVRRVAAMPAVREFLLAPSAAREEAARQALKPLIAPQQQNLVEIWDNAGHRVLAVAVPESADGLLSTGVPPSAGTGPLRRLGDRSSSTVTATVSRDPSLGDARPSDIAGFVSSHRMAAAPNTATSETVRRLIGANGAIGVGNRAGDVWSDLTRFVAAPPHPDRPGVVERLAADGTGVIAAVSLIPDTPLAVSVEFPRAQAVAPATQFVGRLAIGGAVLLLAGIGLTSLVTRQISTPITALTGAAERIAAGDYSSRVEVGRLDEIGRLAVAFNRMTEQVQSDQQTRVRAVRLEEESRRAQEATRLKSEFLANMSHELRTPLNSIIGFAELLHDGQVPRDAPEFREFLHDILTSGKHLLQLINDVLDLAKVESGRFEFHPERTDVGRTLSEVLSVLRTSAAAKQLTVESDVDPALGPITIDPGRFKQVLYNYLSNAIKFTPAAGRVSVRIIGHTAGAFRVEVEDTGIGIAAEDIGRLFVEFQQLEPGAAKKHQGTGLGLALTRRLVEAQGGEVGVRSTLGRGSVFFATFPRQAAHGTPISAPRSFPSPTPGAPRVLVIEDDQHDQDAIVGLLCEAGYAVDTATTAAQALTKLESESYDAITLDLLLPDANGIDVLREVRSSVRHRSVPVVVITVASANGVVAGYGVNDVLSKPVQNAELLEAMRLAVGGRHGRVLVVDDNPGSLRLMGASLAQLGYESVGVADGEAGLRLCREAAPLAVILDLVMPGMSGFEFLVHFRAIPQCQTTPVIIWTVQDLQPADHERLLRSAQGFLSKGHDATLSVVDELRRLLPPARRG